MSRRTQAYTTTEAHPVVPPVGAPPTQLTRRRYGDQAMIGLVTHGNKRALVPIQHPYSGQGASFPAFPFFTGSSVAPDSIRPALFVARNLWSPTSHRNVLKAVIPPPAISPSVQRRPPQTQSGRASGVFTLSQPAGTTWWPTSAMWLGDRMNNPLPSQPPSGWASSRVQSK